MIKPAFVIFLSLLLGLWACDNSRVYEENIEMENKTWVADSALNFEFQIDDPEQAYNLYYNLRNSASYPFQNIYVIYTLKDTLGHQLDSMLVNKNLFHPKTGKPYGSGLGDIFDHKFQLLQNYRFDKAGAYRLKLQQFMRRDSLPEILAVGVRVEKADTEASKNK